MYEAGCWRRAFWIEKLVRTAESLGRLMLGNESGGAVRERLRSVSWMSGGFVVASGMRAVQSMVMCAREDRVVRTFVVMGQSELVWHMSRLLAALRAYCRHLFIASSNDTTCSVRAMRVDILLLVTA